MNQPKVASGRDALHAVATRKAVLNLTPLLCLAHLMTFVDRRNVGLAKTQLKTDVGIGAVAPARTTLPGNAELAFGRPFTLALAITYVLVTVPVARVLLIPILHQTVRAEGRATLTPLKDEKAEPAAEIGT